VDDDERAGVADRELGATAPDRIVEDDGHAFGHPGRVTAGLQGCDVKRLREQLALARENQLIGQSKLHLLFCFQNACRRATVQ